MGTPAAPETILVVDDNPEVLKDISSILKKAKFNVLTARSGAEAVKVAKQRKAGINLVLADMFMQKMNGRELGEILKDGRPDLHVMLMSGNLPDGSTLILNYGWAFIEKPSLKVKLVEMIKDVLSTPNRSQSGGQRFDQAKDERDFPAPKNAKASAAPAARTRRSAARRSPQR